MCRKAALDVMHALDGTGQLSVPSRPPPSAERLMLLRVAFGELPEAETTPVVQDLIADEATSVSQAPMELPKVTPSAGLALEPQVKIGGAPQPSEAVPARPPPPVHADGASA